MIQAKQIMASIDLLKGVEAGTYPVVVIGPSNAYYWREILDFALSHMPVGSK